MGHATQLADFAQESQGGVQAAVFIDLDEDLEGDSEFNSVDLTQQKPPPKRATADWENAASLLNWV